MGKGKDKDQEKWRKEIVVALASNPEIIIEKTQNTTKQDAEATGEKIALFVIAITEKVNKMLEEEW